MRIKGAEQIMENTTSALQPTKIVAPLPQLEEQSVQAKKTQKLAFVFSILTILLAIVPIIGLLFGILGYASTIRAIRQNGLVTGAHYATFVMSICGCMIGGAWFLAAVLFLKSNVL